MRFNAGMIHCIAASADGQIMCSTAEDKSLKVFDVVNFGELGKYILYIIIHKEAIYTNCFYLDLKVVTKKSTVGGQNFTTES